MINVQRLEMELIHMPHTSDNDKKARDNNAKRAQKNEQEQKNIEQGKRAYSKKTDHLLIPSYINNIVDVLFLHFTGKNIKNSLHVHFYILQ